MAGYATDVQTAYIVRPLRARTSVEVAAAAQD